nr:MAG TPA: hypothetical protein [Caudoviricetes sp.]
MRKVSNFPVLLSQYSCTSLKVLQYFHGSTEVLLRKY